MDRLRVAVAVNLPEELCELIERLEPRVDLVRDHRLYRPLRGPADWVGDPSLARSSEDQAAYESMLDDADAIFGIPDSDPAALARAVAANPRLRWVHTMAAGGGGQVRAAALDDAALERVAFTTSAGVHGAPLAEFALFGLLAGAKLLPRLQRQQAEHAWIDRFAMRQLDELTVLVVGLGGIGTQVAARLSALGSTVWGTTRSGAPVDGVSRLVPIDELEQVMPDVDAIVVTLPGTTLTEGLVGASVLGAAHEGLIVVNVGRGTVIDEPALIAALDAGAVGFAALDVTAVEPLPADSPLWDMPNVLISPHTAAIDAREPERIARLFAENATRLLDGEPLRNRVDTVEFY